MNIAQATHPNCSRLYYSHHAIISLKTAFNLLERLSHSCGTEDAAAFAAFDASSVDVRQPWRKHKHKHKREALSLSNGLSQEAPEPPPQPHLAASASSSLPPDRSRTTN